MTAALGLLTEAMYSTESVANGANDWLAPAGDLIWTPQQNVIVWGIDLSSQIEEFTTTLVAAGRETVEITVQITRAAGVNADGVVAQLKNAVILVAQGAVTPTHMALHMTANKYVSLAKGIKVAQTESLGVWLHRRNNTGGVVQMNQLTVVHYETA